MAQLILDPESRHARIVVTADAVDVQIVAPVERLLDELATADVERLEIDLAGVSFADSSVVRLALKAHERLAPKGATVVIKAPSKVSRLFDLTQTAGLFEIVPAT